MLFSPKLFPTPFPSSPAHRPPPKMLHILSFAYIGLSYHLEIKKEKIEISLWKTIYF